MRWWTAISFKWIQFDHPVTGDPGAASREEEIFMAGESAPGSPSMQFYLLIKNHGLLISPKENNQIIQILFNKFSQLENNSLLHKC